MAGSNQEPNLRDTVDIIWVGRADIDPYWNRCSDLFNICSFDTIYDAMAEVLTGLRAGILVVNSATIGPEWETMVKTLLSQDFFRTVYVYGTNKKISNRKRNS